jgi:hypothetical protein
MELKVLFSPIVNNYLKSRYPKGIRYNRADNLTIFIFSLFAVPKPGQITADHPDGVSILLPDQFLHDNRVFIPQVCMDNVSGYVINHINSRGNGEGEGNAAFTFDDVFASDDWQKELRKSTRRSLKRF